MSPSAVAGSGMTDAEVIESGGRCNCKTVDFTKVPKAADIINQGIYILKGQMTVDDLFLRQLRLSLYHLLKI